jgi:haloalkane dehalogenase|tara:strand:+ start:553 stop:1599 length:1047 start_codon:yes stop_codon:yes gene_type:complete
VKTFLRILVLVILTLIILSFFVTRDGNVVTPIGNGQVVLDSGTYEAFPLPIYASNMVDSNYKSYFIEVEPGLKVHVIEAGEGFPVFLMHGNPTSGFLYRKVVEKLPLNKVRVIMPTSLGLGFSSKIPASEHTAENHIYWINKVLKELKLKELVYAGQDWGGPIGMGALSLSPELLKGAVLLNTGFNAPKANADLSPAHALVKTPVIGELLLEVIFSIFERLKSVQGNPDSWTSEVAELYGRPVYESGNSKAPLAMMRMVPDGPNHPSASSMRRIEEYVNTLEIPAEIVWGENDPILGRALPIMQQNFPNARLTKTTAGHFLQEEVPSEIAQALIRVIEEITDSQTQKN